MEIYQLIVGLLSLSQILLFEVRLIHVNLLLGRYFQIDHWVNYEYLCTPICLHQISLHPNRFHIHIEGQRNMCLKQQFPGVK